MTIREQLKEKGYVVCKDTNSSNQRLVLLDGNILGWFRKDEIKKLLDEDNRVVDF